MNKALQTRVREARRRVVHALLAERGPDGWWDGDLSSSALSTATAVIALCAMEPGVASPLVEGGLEWLARHANADGGWGDTTRSRSNPSTTALAWAAFGAAGADAPHCEPVRRAEDYLRRFAGSLDGLVPAIERLYGSDRTFSVPITMALALSGRLGPDGWRRVRPLPFELAMLPRGFFGALRLPVVSYALPALIAIGQVIHARSGRWHPVRSLARRRTLDVLGGLQPSNGGFLEATPLTSFVTMSLAGMGLAVHPVAVRGAGFLRGSARADGSWPIDTNLATWVTTLATKALVAPPGEGDLDGPWLGPGEVARLRDGLISRQFTSVHPYTGAAPGGWAWTDLPGGVPDADDTSGALLALHALGAVDARAVDSGKAGVKWLLGLQNRDGGMPTFCRGWGTLPFDRSTPEITAHAVRAWRAWEPWIAGALAGEVRQAAGRAIAYLRRHQAPDGSWSPLWFGNEQAPGQDNPVYGTAHVLRALGPSDPTDMATRAIAFLVGCQGSDGGWGGAHGLEPTMEETSVALAALAGRPGAAESIHRGAAWLIERVEAGAWDRPAPIGLYFARLWYHERLYPLVFAADALGRLSP